MGQQTSLPKSCKRFRYGHLVRQPSKVSLDSALRRPPETASLNRLCKLESHPLGLIHYHRNATSVGPTSLVQDAREHRSFTDFGIRRTGEQSKTTGVRHLA